jgi:hypothetical protein
MEQEQKPPEAPQNAPQAGGVQFNREGLEKRGLYPGQGKSPEELVNKGMEDYNVGKVDPEPYIAQFEKDGSSSPYGNSLIRAKMVDLEKKADEAMGTPNSAVAEKQATDWAKRVDPILTAWHDTGMVFQGQNALDTGSFSSINKFVKKTMNRDLRLSESAQARKIAKNVTDLNNQINDIKNSFSDILWKEINKLPDMSKKIWTHAKTNYIDKGQISFDNMVNGTALDLNVPKRQVIDALAEAKSPKTMTTEMYKLMSKRRDAVNSAKNWISDLNTPWLVKPFRALHRFVFAETVLGHAVGMETHSGMWKFDPTTYDHYFKGVKDQFHIWGSPVAHEKLLQDVEGNPNYYLAKRSGLAVDVQKSVDQYQLYSNWLGKMGTAGSRSMDALKSFRLDIFNHFWESTPASLKTSDYAKELSSYINHSTGVSDFNMSFGKALNRTDIAGNVLFASRLEGSRWARIIGDPVKHITALTNPNASPAQKAIATFWVKRTATLAGTYLATLAINDGLNMALGSKDRVNFTDPTQSDFLTHKIMGRSVDLSSKLLTPLRFLAHIVQAGVTKPTGGESKWDKMSKAGGSYVRGKLTPAVGLGVDLGIGTDFMGRPLPGRADNTIPEKPTMAWALKRASKPEYTWPEYILGSRGPIPISGAVREIADIWRSQGMSKVRTLDYLKALAVFGTEAVGVPVKPKTAPEMKPEYAYQEQRLIKGLEKHPENIDKIESINKRLEE